MFDISFWELVVVGVVALLVIGPDRLPAVARTAGQWVGRARHLIGTVKADIDREIRAEELRQALERDAGMNEIKQILDSTREDIEQSTRSDYLLKALDDDLYETKDTRESSRADAASEADSLTEHEASDPADAPVPPTQVPPTKKHEQPD